MGFSPPLGGQFGSHARLKKFQISSKSLPRPCSQGLPYLFDLQHQTTRFQTISVIYHSSEVTEKPTPKPSPTPRMPRSGDGRLYAVTADLCHFEPESNPTRAFFILETPMPPRTESLSQIFPLFDLNEICCTPGSLAAGSTSTTCTPSASSPGTYKVTGAISMHRTQRPTNMRRSFTPHCYPLTPSRMVSRLG